MDVARAHVRVLEVGDDSVICARGKKKRRGDVGFSGLAGWVGSAQLAAYLFFFSFKNFYFLFSIFSKAFYHINKSV
jgi:hypothetical protein